MHQITTLKNGLTLITINLPHLDSVTSLVAVGAGSRYETKKVNGISHFLEHMFFKGSRKYPSAIEISTIIDGIGAINNAATSKEFTFYWIKSAAKHINLTTDILASMLKESLLAEEEIEREKGVIVEELRMYRDMPSRYVFDLYEKLLFGDQPVGWDIGGSEEVINSLNRADFMTYMGSLYDPKNMAIVYAGNLPKNIQEIVEQQFSNLPGNTHYAYPPYQKQKQTKPRVDIFYKKTDQANLIMGVEAYSAHDPKRYTAKVLATILGEGMSSRLFIQVRERRGLAYHVSSDFDEYQDTGSFTNYAGLKLEKAAEGLEVIKTEIERLITERVTDDELKKAKELIRGRVAIRSESTNFLAEYFGTNFVLDRKIETFDEYMKNIDAVSSDDIRSVAEDLFKPEHYNLQIIGPFEDTKLFEKILVK